MLSPSASLFGQLYDVSVSVACMHLLTMFCVGVFFSDALSSHVSFSSAVCYGIGNFSDSLIAKYQLSLFLALRDRFSVSYVCSYISQLTFLG